ncbi:MAG: cobalamin-dependent protein [Desulfobacterales bacterium]|jgi:5-methyltetrahydrofolate--homocysteine methyltransferase
MKAKLVSAISTMKQMEAIRLVKEMLQKGENPQVILDGCSEAMKIVGDNYEAGKYFLAELMMAGKILTQISELVQPKMALISSGKVSTPGKVVIGTVKDDIHDIGKDIVAFMLDVNGFEVHDLGIDVPAAKFVSKVKEINPDIVALSGLLTLIFDQMKETVNALKEAGLRNDVKVMIGGCQMDNDIVQYIGADAYRPDAVSGVKLAKEWVGGN